MSVAAFRPATDERSPGRRRGFFACVPPSQSEGTICKHSVCVNSDSPIPREDARLSQLGCVGGVFRCAVFWRACSQCSVLQSPSPVYAVTLTFNVDVSSGSPIELFYTGTVSPTANFIADANIIPNLPYACFYNQCFQPGNFQSTFWAAAWVAGQDSRV
jgi:hypothetical protein